MTISEAGRPILITFVVKDHWVGELAALGLGADCIKLMAPIHLRC